MKFDKVIMNPPYGNLHLPILKEVIMDICKPEEGGEIISLQPIRWLQDPLWKYKKNSDANKMEPILKDKLSSIKVITAEEGGQLFSAWFNFDIGIFHIKNNGTFNYNFGDVFITDRIIKHNAKFIDVLEYNKRDGYRAIVPVIGPTHAFRHGLIFKYLATYSNNGLSKSGIDWTLTRSRNKYTKDVGSNIPYSIKFETEYELENFIESTKTNFIKFLMLIFHRDVNIPVKYLPWMTDYSYCWTDEMFYDYFNVTIEEQKIIETTLKENRLL